MSMNFLGYRFVFSICFYFEFSESSCLSLHNFYMNLIPTHVPLLHFVVNFLKKYCIIINIEMLRSKFY